MVRDEAEPLVLLTGATGYVGGRLLRRLEGEGVPLRCMARRPGELKKRVGPRTQVVEGDVQDRASLTRALTGVECAYYLVHSMGSSGSFIEEDRTAASHFAAAAKSCGVRRIVYLGGLASGRELSDHLASRQEVGRILAESGASVIELRASIIIGSGSLSYEMVRALVEKLPVMIAPRWVEVLAQPIAIEDVTAYLLAARKLPAADSGVFEIGGKDKVSYREIMGEYARQRGLRRLIVPVPVLTPRLSSLWLGLVTPLYARIGRKLIESMRNETIVRNSAAEKAFPGIRPRGIREAIARAIVYEDAEFAQTRWSDALSSGGSPSGPPGGHGARIVDSRSSPVACSSAAAFAAVERIGGATGWYYADWLWNLRGFIDLLAGGVGLRRGRRDPNKLSAGDAVDFWRVEAVEPGRVLRLRAEMKLPGRAWLQFEVVGESPRCSVTQTAIFDPIGVLGLAYWYALYPLHFLIFRGMLRGIARSADGT
jgi:uncharacterized protein YbjT (DUF2867 family)